MDINKKKEIALETGHCLRCFEKRILVKTETDAAKHHKAECYVNDKNKHKFTCLNKTYLLHS